nr:hypothetical protein [Pseudomonas luteola]
MSLNLSTAGNGHLTISLNDLPDSYWLSLVEHMIQVQGLKRVGTSFAGLDEKIHPGFQCPEFSLAAGWDIWSGHYLLAQCAAGDLFLKTLFSERMA